MNVFGIFSSLKKSYKLGKILRKKNRDQQKHLKSLNGNFSVDDIVNNDMYNPTDDIMDMCMSYDELKYLIIFYDIDKNDIEQIYTYLEVSYPLWTKDGHYMPISSFAFGFTLEHLLRNKDTLEKIDIDYLTKTFDV